MALSAEEQAMLANVQSLVQQLMQMEQGEGSVMEAVKEDMPIKDDEKKEDEKEVEEIEKGELDSSEERIEDLPEVTEENLDAIKSLIKRGIISVNKSKAKSANDAVVKSINQLATVLKSVVNDQQELAKAVYGIIEGFDVSGDIKKSLEVKKNEQVANVRSIPDMQVMKAEIIDGVVGRLTNSVEPKNVQKTDVRKSIGEALSMYRGYNPSDNK